MTPLSRLALLLSILPLAATAQEPRTEDLYAWSFETYSFPADDLVRGFTSPERGSLKAPPLPAPDADNDAVLEFLRNSNSITAHYLETLGLALPKGALFAFDPKSMTLAARLPRIGHASVAFTADAYQEDAPKYIAFDQHILEAPAASLRELLPRASANANHQPLLQELQRMADAGEARYLATARTESRSGQRVQLQQRETVHFPSILLVDDEDRVTYETEPVAIGTSWETDPVLGPDGVTIDINTSLEYDFAPPSLREEPITRRGATQLSQTLLDSHEVQLSLSTTMRGGTSKLIGVWTPQYLPAAPPEELLQAAFVTADVVDVLPLPDDRVIEMLRQHGDTLAPIPPGDPQYESAGVEIPEGMIVRRFRVPPSVLTAGASGGGGGSMDDPFADSSPSEPRFTIRATAADILKSMGIPFPEGSSANYLPQSSQLVVRNTPENIQLVEAYVGSLRSDLPASLGIAVYVVQAPGPLLRRIAAETRTKANHEASWQQLREADDVSYPGTFWCETQSGQRARLTSGREHMYLTAVMGGPSSHTIPVPKDAKKPPATAVTISERDPRLESAVELSLIGTEVEVDPILGADGVTIDLALHVSYDYALPALSGESRRDGEGNLLLSAPATTFREANVSTSVTLRHGAIRLAGLWQPRGLPEFDNQDVLQAVFVRASILRPDFEE